MSFNPERFRTESPERDPTGEDKSVKGASAFLLIFIDFAFGFGRRICKIPMVKRRPLSKTFAYPFTLLLAGPGRLLADSSVWLTVARSLAVFEIGKEVKDGQEIEPIVQFSPGIISHPHPFKANIKPRSAKHEELIRAVEIDHPWKKSDADRLHSIQV
jgi:hypothetical protein